ncbi:hypothetical protein [Shinella kummerowiae]|uniref:hypothetical protein n=1 Tax=Shinella kummerowiae TaxID=417745 RepID=UPI0021B64A22|nr:hypothetical protein [Shinella kummerowiae]MCT7662354.1 hypothetical protein [Shinella kummerowiae]
MTTLAQFKLDRLGRQRRCPSCGAARELLVVDSLHEHPEAGPDLETRKDPADIAAAFYTCTPAPGDFASSSFAVDEYGSIVCRQACNEASAGEARMMDADATAAYEAQEQAP